MLFLLTLIAIPHYAFCQSPATGQLTLNESFDQLMVLLPESNPPVEMMSTEVTNALWAVIMQEEYTGECVQCPKTNVNRGDVLEFIDRLNERTGENYRLPRSLDWEAAVLTTNQATRYGKRRDLKAAAWLKSNSRGRLHEVGTKSPNDAGIYDLMGNASEWIDDSVTKVLSSSTLSKELDPLFYEPAKWTVSGGNVSDKWWVCEHALIFLMDATESSPFIGFRLVRDVPDDQE